MSPKACVLLYGEYQPETALPSFGWAEGPHADWNDRSFRQLFQGIKRHHQYVRRLRIRN